MRTLSCIPVLVAAAVALAASGVRADPFFAAPFLVFDTGGSANSTAIADLNADGKPDLLVANGGSLDPALPPPAMSVRLGNGDGTFGPRTDFAMGSYPSCMAVGDLNGDGKEDVVVGSGSPTDTVSVLLGNGDGTFRSKTDCTTVSNCRSLAIGDLNGDGRPDLAVVSSLGSVAVLPGNGDGTFGPKSENELGGLPSTVVIGDLNLDGAQDLVIGDDNFWVSVLLGNGDGTFKPERTYDADCGAHSVAIADLNGDGSPDLAVTNTSTCNVVTVLLGSGDGSFGWRTSYPVGGLPVSVAIGDLNGDGRPDLAVANGYDFESMLSVLLGNGDGTFGARVDCGDGGHGPSSVAIGDLNTDGELDLAVACGNTAVLLGNGDGTFGQKNEHGTGGNPRALAIAQLDGDGLPDLAIANWDSSTVSVLLGNGDATFDPKNDFNAGASPSSLANGDLNGDGKTDLVVANRASDKVSVLLGNGDGTFESGVDQGTGSVPSSVAIGDLNGDGKGDLVVANEGSAAVSVLLGNGDGTFRPRIDHGTGLQYLSAVAIGDLNGDGKEDLVVGHTGYAFGKVSVLLGRGDGTFSSSSQYEAGAWCESVAIGDLNGDLQPDLAVANELSNTVSVFLGNGDGTFQPKIDFGVGGRPSSVAIGDLNADGKAEIVTANYLSNTVSVLGTFVPRIDYATGRQPSFVGIGDLDGDGKPELAVANSYSNTVSVLRNVSTAAAASLSFFKGAGTAGGIELRWRFGVPAEVFSALPERSDSVNGPWAVVNGERHDEAGTTVLLDGDAVTGRNYYYRLAATSSNGDETIHGPLAVTAGIPASEPDPQQPGLLLVAPNPSRGVARIEFAAARQAYVRLSVMDVQGRSVALLADGVYRPGRYPLVWDGRGKRGPAPAGLYFVCFETEGRRYSRRLAIVP